MNDQNLLIDPARGPAKRAKLLLAHGAGAPADSPYMETLADALAGHGTDVIRFEFPYMADRRIQGSRRPPPRAEKLIGDFRSRFETVLSERPDVPVFVGGKSMGGRVASLLTSATDCPVALAGVICFGYPFHPSGKPDRWRIEHLPDLNRPGCIVQGTRDPFGRPDEVADYPCIARSVTLRWVEGGDHDLCPLKSSGRRQRDLIAEAACHAAEFIDAVIHRTIDRNLSHYS